MAELDHKGWHRRGYLPHFDPGAAYQFTTYRLADSLPKAALQELRRIPKEQRQLRSQRFWELLDAGHGSCCLQQENLASIVQDNLLHFHGERYELLAWSVMPNHVHTVIALSQDWPLDKVVHSWKSYTATAINKELGRSGRLWMPDYFDVLIKDESMLEAIVRYTEYNPVAAGLCHRVEDWPYSSAGYRGYSSV